MSWWDYGHWITAIAHRIPVANPFQQNARTAANYLIETDENKANNMLDELDVKYIITDYPMVDFLATPTYPNPKYVMPIWAGKNPNPFQTIEVRLHYFDGSERLPEGIPALQHYRLVYESSTFVLPYMLTDPETEKAVGWRTYHGSQLPIENDLELLHNGVRMEDIPYIASTPRIFSPMAYVKIFEYVDGKIVKEEAPLNSSYTLSVDVITNQGREFVYNQTQVEDNGYCTFVVPYEGEYRIEVKND